MITNATMRLVIPATTEEALLDYLAPPERGLSLASIVPCRATLAVADGQLMLALRLQGGEPGQRLPLLLPIQPDWQAPLLWAFEPVLRSQRQLTIRPCLVRLEWTGTGLALDLAPQDGRRQPVMLPAGMSLAWLQRPLTPVAAAVVVAISSGLPVAAADYVVKPGDTLWGISQTHLGSGQRWRKLLIANPRVGRDPRRLMPGTRLHLPESRQAATVARQVVVRRGDTLYGLAQRIWGDGNKWPRLWQALKGHIASPEQLPVGTVIPLPGRTVAPPVSQAHHAPAPQTAKKPLPAHPPASVHPAAQAQPTPAPTAAVTPAPQTSAEPLVPASQAVPSTAPSIVSPVIPSPEATGLEPVPSPLAEPSGAEPSPAPSTAASPTDASSPTPTAMPGLASDTAAEPAGLSSVSSSEAPPAEPSAPIEATETPTSVLTSDAAASPAALDGIERPFGSHVALSYTPANVTEALTSRQLSGEATLFQTFGARAAWRALPEFELSGAYLMGNYVVDRGNFGQGARAEQHGRVMADYVWPLMPNLELAAGLGGQAGFYGSAVTPIINRPADYFDSPYQRLMLEAEAKVGYRPIAQLPLTLTAGVSALPVGTTLNGTEGLPGLLWGLGWQAGARYTFHGLSLEAGYRGQRVWGSSFQQSSDLLHGTVGYYFQ